MADYDYTGMLAWRKGHVQSRGEAGQVSDGSLSVLWRVPIAAKEGAADWIKTNRATITGTAAAPIIIDGAKYEDVYRLIDVDYGRIQGKTIDLIVNFAPGHVAALTWADARIDEGFERPEDDEVLRVIFPNINHSNIKAIRDSVRGVTYTDPTIGGDPYTGTYKVLHALLRWTDDQQSASELVITMGDPELRMDAFRNYGLPSQEDIIYFNNVPDNEAQALVDGYQIEGYTAVIQRPTDIPGTSDVVITSNADITVADLEFIVGEDCETDTTFTYRWGLSRAEVEAFVVGFTARETGLSKGVQVSFSSDTGKYNVIATVSSTILGEEELAHTVAITSDITQITTYKWNLTKEQVEAFVQNLSTPVEGQRSRVSVSRARGGCVYHCTSVVETMDAGEELDLTIGAEEEVAESYEYRWNKPKDFIDAFIAAGGYETQEEGKDKSVRVSRNNRFGTYDIVGLIRDRTDSEVTLSLTIGVTALSSEVREYRWNITKASLESFAADYATSQEGARKSFQINRGQNNLYNVVGLTLSVEATTDIITHGTYAEEETLEYSFEVPPSQKNSILSALGSDDTTTGNRAVSVSRNGNGNFDVVVRFNKSKADNTTFSWSTGGIQHEVNFYFGQERDTIFATLAGLPNDGTDYNINLSRASDGTFSMVVRKSFDGGLSITATIGNEAETESYKFLWGITEAEATVELEALAVDSSRQDKNISLRRNNRDGTLDLFIIQRDETAKTHGHDVEVGANYTETFDFGWSQELDSVPLVANPAVVGVAERVEFSRDRQGNIDYRHRTRTVTPWLSDVFVITDEKRRVVQAQLFSGYQTIPAHTTTYGGVQAQFDEATQTYSGTIREVLLTSEAATQDDWDNFESPDWISTTERIKTWKNGKQYYIDAEIRHKTKQTRSRSAAESFLKDGPGGAHPTGSRVGAGWKFEIVGGDKFRVVYVDAGFDGSTELDTAIASWNEIG